MRKTIILLLSLSLLVSCSKKESSPDYEVSLLERMRGEWFASYTYSIDTHNYKLSLFGAYGVESYDRNGPYQLVRELEMRDLGAGQIEIRYDDGAERTDLVTLFENDEKMEVCRHKNLQDCITFDRVK